MINLLPPPLKEELRYSRLNRLALAYLRLALMVLVVLTAIFVGTIFYLNLQADQVARDVAVKEREIAANAEFLKSAKDASDRLNAIKYVQSTQTRFSLLLSDLAKVLPKGTSIDSITLTGDDKKPIRVAVTGSSYSSMLAFREALVKSPRISGVDLENITENNGSAQASVVIGFKPGQAR
jgi:Tfp pilus assembly protein PilN